MKMPARPDREARLKLRDTPGLTLDGEPANLINISGQFPIIHSKFNNVEFAWQTVQYVIDNAGGRFKS